MHVFNADCEAVCAKAVTKTGTVLVFSPLTERSNKTIHHTKKQTM